MRPKNDQPEHRTLASEARARDEAGDGQRHSDVVPRTLDVAAAAGIGPDTLLGLTAHLSWPETPGWRVPDERRTAWMNAYETSFEHAFESCERGDWLVPLVYAEGANDERLARALLRFAHEISLELEAPEEALAMLEVVESMLLGEIGKDLCLRIADNLIDEAYERFTADRAFDRYYFCHCAAAVARLASRVRESSSARDAVDAIHSGVAALRNRAEDSEPHTLAAAARLIREEISHAQVAEREPGQT